MGKWGERATRVQCTRHDYQLIGRMFTRDLKRRVPEAWGFFDFSHNMVFILKFQVAFKGDFCVSQKGNRVAYDTNFIAL